MISGFILQYTIYISNESPASEVLRGWATHHILVRNFVLTHGPLSILDIAFFYSNWLSAK